MSCRRLAVSYRPPLANRYILLAMEKITIQHGSFGMLWCAAWLFTLGFLHLSFWKGVLAIILWPYFLGVWYGALPH